MKIKSFTLPLIYLAIVGVCLLSFVVESNSLLGFGFIFSAPGLLIPILIHGFFGIELNLPPLGYFLLSVPLSLCTYIPLGFFINKLATHKSMWINILIYLSTFPTTIFISWLLATPFIGA